jgi:hypothetical protein
MWKRAEISHLLWSAAFHPAHENRRLYRALNAHSELQKPPSAPGLRRRVGVATDEDSERAMRSRHATRAVRSRHELLKRRHEVTIQRVSTFQASDCWFA